MDLLYDSHNTLLIAIFGNCSIETAFMRWENPNSENSAELTQADVEDMCKLKQQGLTNTQYLRGSRDLEKKSNDMRVKGGFTVERFGPLPLLR